jgi:hypothetical protein
MFLISHSQFGGGLPPPSFLNTPTTGALVIADQTPGYSWGAVETWHYPLTIPWMTDVQVSAAYTIPMTPYLGLFSGGRLWVNPHSGEATVALNISQDNGTTWYPLTEWETTGTWTVSGTPQQAVLPSGIPQLQGIVTPLAGTTPTISITLTAY